MVSRNLDLMESDDQGNEIFRNRQIFICRFDGICFEYLCVFQLQRGRVKTRRVFLCHCQMNLKVDYVNLVLKFALIGSFKFRFRSRDLDLVFDYEAWNKRKGIIRMFQNFVVSLFGYLFSF